MADEQVEVLANRARPAQRSAGCETRRIGPPLNLTELLESWVRDAERMGNAPARGVVVTGGLFAALAREQARGAPLVASLPSFPSAMP